MEERMKIADRPNDCTDLHSQSSKKFKSVTLGLVGFVAALYLLSLAMVIVGALNINTCQSIVVPVYLMVAGVIQLSSLLFRTIAWIAEKCGMDSEMHLCDTIRIVDCFTIILFICLFIGSNWITIRLTQMSTDCNDGSGRDYIFMEVNSTMPGSEGDRDYEVPEGSGDDMCQDCTPSLYMFTYVVIVLQYIMVILMCLSCCSELYKSRCSGHDSHSYRKL